MTTIIERPEGGDSGMVVIAAIVGALAAGVVGLFAFGAFDRNPASTTVTVEQPAMPATPTEAAPPAQSAPAPAQETAPSTEPPPPATPDTTEPEPAAPPAPPPQ